MSSILSRNCTDVVRVRVRNASGSCIETIAEPADVDEVPRSRRVGLELAAQSDNVIVHGTIVDRYSVPPRSIQQLIPRQHTAAVPHENAHQPELESAQIHNFAAAAHLAARKVDLDVAEPERLRVIGG